MNKNHKIAHYKKMEKAAQQMQAVAMQNFSIAARLESEAKSALVELGVLPGRPQKGKYELPADIKMMLDAGLTNDK